MRLSYQDNEQIQQLENIRRDNFTVLSLFADYLNYNSQFITGEQIHQMVNQCGMNPTEAFIALFSAWCNLEGELSETNAALESLYFRPAIKQLKPQKYYDNSYFRNFLCGNIPVFRSGQWELKIESYQPYEVFVRGNIQVEPNFREIPQLGYFDREFSFPALLQNGREWMTVTPNEIETMNSAVAAASGRVLTFGLGLGYFIWQAAEKAEVNSIIAVEKDPALIALFKNQLLPHFPHPQKIQIIQQDAFEFIRENTLDNSLDTPFDFVFVDIWHDVSDGAELYVKMKPLEKILDNRFNAFQYRLTTKPHDSGKSARWMYWIEPEILSYLRWRLFDKLNSPAENPLIAAIQKDINSFSDFRNCLTDEFLQNQAKQGCCFWL